MKVKPISYLTAVLFFLFLTTAFFPQTKGDIYDIKPGVLHSNEISLICYNYGAIGAPNVLSGVLDFVWKDLGYMYEFSPVLSGEVTGASGETLQITSDGSIRPMQGDYDPSGSIKWGWLPRTGFTNTQSENLPTRADPGSWLDDWGNQWYGELGFGKTIGLDEAYFVMDDFTNEEFNYFPNPDNSDMRGLGVKAETRIYQPGGGMRDVIIVKTKLTNESPKNLSKLYFGYWGDPHIGGAFDYADDRIGYTGLQGFPGDPYSSNTFYCYDADMTGMGGKPAGFLSFRFLETPGDLGMTAFKPMVYTNSLPNVPLNDPLVWSNFEAGIDSTSELLTTSSDYVIHMGTGPFALAPGESKDIVLAVFCGANLSSLMQTNAYLIFHYNWLDMLDVAGQNEGDPAYAVSLDFNASNPVSGIVPVNWNYSGSDPAALIFLEYSRDKGKSWQTIAYDLPAAPSQYLWDTEADADGVNYLLRAVAYDPGQKGRYYYSTTSRFTVNNPVNAVPEIEFLTSFDSLTIRSNSFLIKFLAEDADNSNLTMSLEYGFAANGPFFPVFSNVLYPVGSVYYALNTTLIPNSDSYYLRLSGTDGIAGTSIVTPVFEIWEREAAFKDTIIKRTAGRATPVAHLDISDLSLLRFDDYQITFTVSESQKTFSVKNLTQGTFKVQGQELLPNVSTPAFDGLKLKIIDQETRIDGHNTYLNNFNLSGSYQFQYPPSIGNPKVAAPEDWIMVFNNFDTLASGQYVYPGDTVINHLMQPVICPFRLLTEPDYNKGDFMINESTPSLRNNGKWDFQEPVILRPTNPAGATTSYEILFDFYNGLPSSGDTLFIRTLKEITEQDTFAFKPTNAYHIVKVNEILPETFTLSQNYPNPFNPTTRIDYSLPAAGNVKLEVFNILGEKVATIKDEFLHSGTYTETFNGARLSSGVYIYTISFGDKFVSRKMLLLK